MPQSSILAAFSQSYAEARAKFIAAANTRGLTVESHVHPSARGIDGEALSVDAAILGSADGASLLCVISGTHGVEGFCGSGAQIALLGGDHDEGAVRLEPPVLAGGRMHCRT